MSNIVCPECWASAIVNHQPSCSQPEYVDLREPPSARNLNDPRHDQNVVPCDDSLT